MNRSFPRAQSRGAQSIASDQDGNDMMAEVEYQKLQRQFRIMEGNRKAYGDESRLLITKQRNHIEVLSKEHQHLIQEMMLLQTRQEATKASGLGSKRANELAEQAELYLKGFRTAQARLVELEKEYMEIDAEISSQRQDMGGVHAAAQTNTSIQKQVRILENRLDKALVKFNKSLAWNRRLREHIDSLRRERIVFDTVYKKHDKELAEQKKAMADIIEMSNSAYEARDEAQAKILALREKAEREFQAYTQELKELNRVLEQDRKLKNFMAIKGSERSGSAPVGEGRHSKKASKAGDNSGGKGSLDMLTETVENYEQAFNKIKEVTGVSDVQDLVKRFTQMEDQNFSLFNYVNEQNNEIEKISEEVSTILESIDKLKADAEILETERKATLKELETKLNATNEKREQYVKLYTEARTMLEEINSGVDSLFKSIKCDAGSLTDMLGSEGVNEANVMQYLGIIEQRANELLKFDFLYNKVDVAADAETSPPAPIEPLNKGTLLGSGPSAPVGSLVIQAPSTGDDHDSEEGDSEEDERPLTREELLAKTLRNLAKREKQNALKGEKQAKAAPK